MKKVSWLNLITSMLIILTSCRPSAIMTISNTCDATTIDVSKFELNAELAQQMINSYRGHVFLFRRRPNMFIDSPGVRARIAQLHPDAKIEYIFVRYTGDSSVNFYRDQINQNTSDPKAWNVKNYTTMITRVTETKKEGTNFVVSVSYYNYGKICPPPANACR